MKTEWKQVSDGLSRIGVDGGWLYRRRNDSGMTFVPSSTRYSLPPHVDTYCLLCSEKLAKITAMPGVYGGCKCGTKIRAEVTPNSLQWWV